MVVKKNSKQAAEMLKNGRSESQFIINSQC